MFKNKISHNGATLVLSLVFALVLSSCLYSISIATAEVSDTPLELTSIPSDDYNIDLPPAEPQIARIFSDDGKSYSFDLNSEALGSGIKEISIDAGTIVSDNFAKEENSLDAKATVTVGYNSGEVSDIAIPVEITSHFTSPKHVGTSVENGLCDSGKGEDVCWYGHVPAIDTLYFGTGESYGPWNYRTEFFTKKFYASFVYDFEGKRTTVSNISPGMHYLPNAVYVTGQYMNLWS